MNLKNKLVVDYINGNYISDYDIEELENDREFMIKVFNVTNDKNFYYLCSEELKKDYFFVKYLLKRFSKDIGFICMVADEFLDNYDDFDNKIDILVLMNELTIDDENRNFKYSLDLRILTIAVRVETQIYRNSPEFSDIEKDIGMGFALLYKDFADNEKVLNYFASSIIDSIIKEGDINLEDHIHKAFNDFDKIESIGINNFLLNFISCYDVSLSNYLSKRLFLLDELIDEMYNIKLNWENYNEMRDAYIYDAIFDKVSRYVDVYASDCILGETEMLYYVADKLGIFEDMKKYDPISEDIVKLDIDLADMSCFDYDELSFKDKVHLKRVEKIIVNCLNGNINDYNETENNNIRKVLKFVPRNN